MNRLLTNKIEKLKKNELLKQENEKQEITKTCTFHPEINQEFEIKDDEKINLLAL